MSVNTESGCKALKEDKGTVYNTVGERIWSRSLSARVVSTSIRESDPTILDVTYELTGTGYGTADVRVLMFRETAGSWATVIRPETFVDGTEKEIGDGMKVNAQHTISWRITADTKDTLAKYCAMIIVRPGELLPFRFATLPAGDGCPAYRVSLNAPTESQVQNALWWLYADHEDGLTIENGVLKNEGTTLASGTSVGYFNAEKYLYEKMGYESVIWNESVRRRVNSVLRMNLSSAHVFETVK